MARSPLNRCPKCSSKITSRVECTKCGLLFARYTMVQAKKKAAERAKAAQRARFRQQINFVLSLFLFALIGGAFYYYKVLYLSSDQQPVSRRDQIAAERPSSTVVKQQSNKSVSVSSQDSQNAAPLRSKNAFETAKRSIVSIETPWGTSGIGFFIEENMVITSRYLVEYNKGRQEEYVTGVERTRVFIEREMQEIKGLREETAQMSAGTAKDEQMALIDEREKRLSKIQLIQEKREERLAQKKNSTSSQDVTVTASDGRTLQIYRIQMSNNYDLALFQVVESDVPFIARPPEGLTLQKGETVYSLGAGGKGIAATFVEQHQGQGPGENYVQTDAAISPEYSGAPLIDADGYIFGVSTTSLRNTTGTGSAIPLGIVIAEFQL